MTNLCTTHNNMKWKDNLGNERQYFKSVIMIRDEYAEHIYELLKLHNKMANNEFKV